jgi:PPP family 3-phenylpropionic acid transporter
VRLLLLALFHNPVVAVAVQLLHGPTVLLVHVAPPIFLNARADDRYRNSIQGLYAMVFAGAGKVIGSWTSGVAAERSLPWTFAGAGAVCLVAMAMFYFVFADHKRNAHAGLGAPGRDPDPSTEQHEAPTSPPSNRAQTLWQESPPHPSPQAASTSGESSPAPRYPKTQP